MLPSGLRNKDASPLQKDTRSGPKSDIWVKSVMSKSKDESPKAHERFFLSISILPLIKLA